jgi:hypothetical protein
LKLRRFVAHVDAVAGPALAASGRVAAGLIVGFGGGVLLTDGGHDLDSYLFPVAQRRGRSGSRPSSAARSAGRRHERWDPPSRHGPGQPAVPGPDGWVLCRQEWKQQLHDRLAVQAAPIDPGPAGLSIALRTGPGRTWASLGKPLTGAFGPVLGEDPARPFHSHDDRIVSLALHHTTGTSIAHDVITGAWWTRL